MVELRQRKGSAKKAADGEQLSENGMLEEVRRSTEGEDKPAPAPATEPPAVMQQGFWKKFAVRAQMASLMMAAFLSIARARTMAFREIVSVRYSEYKSVDGAGRLPLFRTLQWGWYYVALVFVYGDFIKEFAYSHERGQDVLLHYARHHEALAFAGYCLVFMLSVWTLTATTPSTSGSSAPRRRSRRAHKTLSCETRAVFVKQAEYDVLGLFTLEGVAPIQLHAVCFALFASIVAPFGASSPAIKRAYHVKDFDSIIPGHGGVTDRVDCEFIMALFVYVYHKTFIREYDAGL
ncbi:phosphatidate cytidylyltransferase [Aureococcus anophagefferens]|nr:phosphatidate cytidylyltransferase [Aureococcus anophagefferens]